MTYSVWWVIFSFGVIILKVSDYKNAIVGTGYSGKPVWQKLGVFEGCRLRVCGQPKDYSQILTGAPKVEFIDEDGGQLDILHVFATKQGALVRDYTKYSYLIKEKGFIWVSWPKKISKVPTDITEQTLRDLILPLGWVDTKVCAVSDIWSGLKFMRRRQKQ
jgi:hypothetical protein